MTNCIAPIEKALYENAEAGLFYLIVELSKKQIKNLKEDGFFVFDMLDQKSFPRLHKIDWKQSVVETNDINSLNENDDKYSLSKSLWIISMKSMLKNNKSKGKGKRK